MAVWMIEYQYVCQCVQVETTFIFPTECRDVVCPRGKVCRLHQPTNEAYCDPSCDVDNGGCASDQICSVTSNVTCTTPPCLSVVECSGLSVINIARHNYLRMHTCAQTHTGIYKQILTYIRMQKINTCTDAQSSGCNLTLPFPRSSSKTFSEQISSMGVKWHVPLIYKM